jgi:hypothetical protein
MCDAIDHDTRKYKIYDNEYIPSKSAEEIAEVRSYFRAQTQIFIVSHSATISLLAWPSSAKAILLVLDQLQLIRIISW